MSPPTPPSSAIQLGRPLAVPPAMMTSDAKSEPVSGVPALASPSTSSQPQQASPADPAAEPTTSLFGFFSRMALARTTTSGPMQSGDEDGEPFSEQEHMAAAERQLAAETASLGSDDDGDDDNDSDGLSTETSTPTGWDPAHPSRSASPVQDSDAASDIGKQTWTAQDKVEALQKEFGPAAADSSERWLAESYGGPTTRSGLLIVGSLHVTSHRLLFYGKMPSLNDVSDASPSGRPIKTGAACAQKVYNRFGIESTHRKRIWLELENDMVTSYRDSTARGRTEPLKVVRLSAIKRILDETLPLVIEFEIYNAPPGKSIKCLEFDTQESTLAWRKEFSAALFNHDRRRRLAQMPPQEQHELARRNETVSLDIPFEALATLPSVSDPLGIATHLDLALRSRISTASGNGSPRLTTDDQVDVSLRLLVDRTNDHFISQLVAAAAARRPATAMAAVPVIHLQDVLIDFLRRDGASGSVFAHANDQGASGPARSLQDEDGERMCNIFGLGDSTGLWSITCALQRALIPHTGLLVISPRFFGFWRRSYNGNDVIVRHLVAHVEAANICPTGHLSSYGMRVAIHKGSSMNFEFSSEAERDSTLARTKEMISSLQSALAAATDYSSRKSLGNPASSMHSPTSLSRSSSWSGQSGSSSRLLLKPRSLVSPTARDSLTLSPQTTRSQADEPDERQSSTSTDERAMSPASFVGDLEAERHYRLLAGPLVRTKDASTYAIEDKAYMHAPRIVNLSAEVHKKARKLPSGLKTRHFCMLTIGSRGDVQPYVALSLELMKHGHRCTIITHDEFQEWVEGYGIGFRQAGGDPAALMKLSVEHKMFSPGFFKESLGHFREWLDQLFHDAWVACHDADVLIESPSAMAGIHIAEALKIPYFRAFTMPWTRTHDYPQAFMVPPVEMSGQFNYSTYLAFDNIIWKASSGQVNRWRVNELQLKPTNMTRMRQRSCPFVYNFSSAVVPHPLDWKDNIMISGYWFLPAEKEEWVPPADLADFIERAHADEKPLVYIGFGSIVVPNPAETTRAIIRAVGHADVRAIVAKGWSSRGEDGTSGKKDDVPFPASCYSIDKVPHDWLFDRIDAAVHHGGAGTTGASLRAGLPTIIKPWFGDQHFWALRAEKLGCGIRVNSLNNDELGEALIRATRVGLMRETAWAIGEKIRAEDGCERTVQWLYSHLRLALDRHSKPVARPASSSASRVHRVPSIVQLSGGKGARVVRGIGSLLSGRRAKSKAQE